MCSVLPDGRAQCWGSNQQGQIGADVGNQTASPVAVAGLPGNADAIFCGWGHTCAVVAEEVWCWGTNFDGQLGNDAVEDSTTPVQVAF